MKKSMNAPATLAAIVLCLSCATAACANNVTIRDDAGVLSAQDQQSITQAAQSVPFGVTVWTVKGGYANNQPGFARAAEQRAGSNPVVIGVDTGDKLSQVSARQNTGLLKGTADQVKLAARPALRAGDWAGGITAALQSLSQAAPAGGTTRNMAPVGTYRQPNNGGSYNQTPYNQQPGNSGGGVHFGSVILILLVIGGLVILARRMMGGGINRGLGGGYPQTLNQPGVGPAYGPGGQYGPGYNQGGGGGGIGGGLMAGGLGAAAGGLLGYELGKSAGEHDQQGNFGGGNVGGGGFGGNNDQGGFVESDTSQSNAGDFGGGDSGGGSDFGGGGGDFGGGDFGGGGGDFGGGDGGSGF